MTFALIATLALCVFLSAVLSGSEIASYSVSRARVEAEASHGSKSAQWIRSLLSNEALLLASMLVANNLVNQIATLVTDRLVEPLGLSELGQDALVTVAIVPVLLFFGEMFPKDLFRRRPHALLGRSAPLLLAARLVLAPLTYPLMWVSALLARLLGLGQNELSLAQGREAVFELLRERETQLQPHVEKLARNVLELRARRVDRVMVPWRRVDTIPSGSAMEEVRSRVAQSGFSRLPVVDAKGVVRGYVHQLEVLGAEGDSQLERHLRPLLVLPPDTPLDRALARLRTAGQRAALIGVPARPVGWVTLKDLVEEISGELARW